jgi:penicillin amidase
VRFVYADVDGRTEQLTTGRVPLRPPGTGQLVTPGWISARGWRGWTTATASDLNTRGAASLPPGAARVTPDDLRTLQSDVHAPQAARLLPLLAAVKDIAANLAPVRAELTAWDGNIGADSAAARIYVRWEAALRTLIAERLVPGEFVRELAGRLDLGNIVTQPRLPWFEPPFAADRDLLLVQALAAAAGAEGSGAGQQTALDQPATLTFRHPLAVFDASRRRFDVGPFPRPGYYATTFATDAARGPTLRAIFDLSDWDRSTAIVAPGESGAASSLHYDDLAPIWSQGGDVSLAFSRDAVAAAARDTLQLIPPAP